MLVNSHISETLHIRVAKNSQTQNHSAHCDPRHPSCQLELHYLLQNKQVINNNGTVKIKDKKLYTFSTECINYKLNERLAKTSGSVFPSSNGFFWFHSSLNLLQIKMGV